MISTGAPSDGMDTFDATYGYDESALLTVGAPDEPEGFAAFWAGLFERAMDVDVDIELAHSHARHGVDVFDVGFTSLGGVRLGGWVSLPQDRPVRQAMVISHGYGGRDAPDLDLVPAGSAAIFPVSRGLPARSLLDAVPPDGVQHVLHGIESVETYVHGGCAADVWCAASTLLQILGESPARVGYVGGSFGGGIGAMALPWDDRFTAGALYVPSFGNHDLRLSMPCDGSGEAIRVHVASHPEARQVLRYFDAATAARRLRIPMLVAPALSDPAVPPPGQFAVHNAIPEPKELVVFGAGHAEYPEQDADYQRYLDALHRLFAVH